MRIYYPPAELLLVPYLNERRRNGRLSVPLFSPQPTRWTLHCQAGKGSCRWFQDLKYPDRKNSHLWVSYEGKVEQYVPLNRWSWAQGDGNSGWISVETEGTPDEPLTEAQLNALARWHVWIGATDRVTNSVKGQGIGTHVMGGTAWGGHECPGKIRAGQRGEIIKRAIALRAGHHQEDDDVNLDDKVSISGKDKNPFDVRTALRGSYLASLDARNDLAEIKNQMSTALRRLQEIEDRVQRLEK